MTTLRPRHPVLASLPFIAVAVVATAVAAQTPPPVAVGGRVMMDSLSSRMQAQRALIRALVAAHYPDVLEGKSNVNRIAFVLDENDAYVTSAGIVSATPPAAPVALGGSMGVGGGAGARVGGAGGGGGGGGGAVAGGFVRARGVSTDTVAAAAGPLTNPGPIDLNAFGLGTIERSLIRGTAASSYGAGSLAPNWLEVFIVRLKGTQK